MDYLLAHHDKLLYLLAGLSFVIELSLIGLSGPLLFFGIACAVTGVLVSAGLINTWEYEVLCVGVLSLMCALLLWKPLKKFQGGRTVKDNSSDMIGQIVPVSVEVTLNGGNIRHSGINWNARLDVASAVDSLAIDSRVEITGVEGNVIIVREVSKA